MARLRWMGRESGRAGAGRHLAGEATRGHPLVVGLAREELARAAPAGGGSAGDLEVAADRFRRACRTFGVVLAAAATGLDRVESYLYRPLRDAAFLTAKLLEGEVAERARAGVPLRSAFDEVAGFWLQDFGMLLVAEKLASRPDAGLPSRVSTVVTRAASSTYQAYPPYSYPPHLVLLQRAEEAAGGRRARMGADPVATEESARRMRQRRATFQACDADFEGPGGREVMRAIFVTALLIHDAVGSRAKKAPPKTFAASYHEVLGRYKTAIAKLVLNAEAAAEPRSRSGA